MPLPAVRHCQLPNCLLRAVLHCQLPKCLLRRAGGVRLAHLGSKDAAAAPKHHGSEGRIGPAAGSPECQTLLSERLETSCKPCLYLPFCTASFLMACCVLQVAFVWQHHNTMAVKDGSGLRPAAQIAKTSHSERLAANLAFTCRSALPASKLLAASCRWRSSGTPQVQGLPRYQNTMAVKDGSGPRPAAQTPKRCFLNVRN